jgi:hypothetical protein
MPPNMRLSWRADRPQLNVIVSSANSLMFYALVLLSVAAFVLHLVVLDRLQRFRIRPVRNGWWSFFNGLVQYPYSPKSYTGDARRLLGWVYASGIAWLLFVSLAGLVLKQSR